MDPPAVTVKVQLKKKLIMISGRSPIEMRTLVIKYSILITIRGSMPDIKVLRVFQLK